MLEDKGIKLLINVSQNFVTQSEGAPSTGHSPLKLRHSVDFGVERGRLLSQEGREVEFIIRLSLLLQAGFLFFLFSFSFFLFSYGEIEVCVVKVVMMILLLD